ncbi:phosphotransferase family protein [Halegenticoccus tardaugens]|uniref:phosphotransferase family protein n=1 Tax=Halegenticoccus tardaugens TaxID=2071624 RepID=UPI00100AAD1C|nr:phosphotransferase family protein [Halegenticoccus tardaugens]
MSEDRSYADRLVDERRLRAYLASELGDAETFDVEWHQKGHSNETLFVTWGDRDLVLRRPPPGETADTAHDVGREFRVMSALQGTAVPAPSTVLHCEDDSVIGSEFYLMERVDGEVVRLDEPERFAAPDRRAAVGRELVDSLAAIHNLDYESVGLGDFGDPDGYLRRQIDRWKKQLQWAASRTNRPNGLPGRDEVEAWLDDACPEEADGTLVHGDYKLDNVIVAPGTPPQVNAVVDWELCTLGAPLSDLGWMLLFWHDDPSDEPPIPELMPAFTAREGYPDRLELVERYENRTGVAFEHPTFYLVLATYKLAGVCEMFYARHLAGDSDDPLYAAMDEGTPSLIAYTQDAIRGIGAW